jgi:hypothetical protein
VYAYKLPADAAVDPQNATQEDLRDYYDTKVQQQRETFQDRIAAGDVEAADSALGKDGIGTGARDLPSAYTQTEPATLNNPSSGNVVEVREVGAASLGLTDRLAAQESLLNFLQEVGLEGIAPGVLTELSDKSEAEIESLHGDLVTAVQASPQACKAALRQRGVVDVSDCTAAAGGTPSTGSDGYVGPVNAGYATGEAVTDETVNELESQVTNLSRTLETVRDSVASEPPETDVGSDGTVSVTFPFGEEVAPEQALIFVEYADGSTTVLNGTSEYVSVRDQLTSTGSEVTISEYPLKNGSSVANIRAQVATAEGVGSSETAVRNPNYNGEVPGLSSLRVSDMTPQAGESVSVTANAPPESAFGSVVAVEVIAPNGTTTTVSNVTSGDTAEFDTSNPGIYRVTTVFQPAGAAQNFSEVTTVRARASGGPRAPSIMSASGPTGRYAVVDGPFADGYVETTRGGQSITAEPVLQERAETPSTVEVHLETAPLAKESRTTVRLLQGPQEQQVGEAVNTRVYYGSVAENALVYRGDDIPLTTNTGAPGRTDRSNGTLTVIAPTNDNGELQTRVINDPSRLQSLFFRGRVIIGSADVPGIGFIGPDTLALGGLLVVVTPVGGLAWWRRRGESR